MVDDGYLIGYEDGNGDFVEVGRFNNFDETVTGPILLKHANSGETLEIDANGFDFTGPILAPSATIDGKSSPYATETELNNKADDPHDNTQHSETYTTTAEDVENFSTSGASGTAPVSQGDGTLAMESVGGGDFTWTEDGNSPQSFTGSDSYTFTLADTSVDEILVRAKIRTQPSTDQGLNLTVNGDSGANYSIAEYGGTTGSASEVELVKIGTRSIDADGFVFTCDGTFVNNWTMNNESRSPTSSVAHAASNSNITSPLTSFTLSGSSAATFAIDIEVYGRTLG